MESFFQKYPLPPRKPSERHAIKMMITELEKALKDLDREEDYCEHIHKVRSMADDFLTLKDYDPNVSHLPARRM